MSEKRLQLDDARRHLASAKCSGSHTLRVCHLTDSLDALLAALGEQQAPDGRFLAQTIEDRDAAISDANFLREVRDQLHGQLAEVRRQHDQTRKERDRYAKRVAELEDVVRVARNGLDDILPDSALHPTEAGA